MRNRLLVVALALSSFFLMGQASAPTTRTPKLTVDGNLTVRGTANIVGAIKQGGNTIDFASFATPDTGTPTVTYSGFTTTVSGTGRYSVVGDQVCLYLPPLTGTSNSTQMRITGFPAAIQPTTQVRTLERASFYNNGSPGTLLAVHVFTDGSIRTCANSDTDCTAEAGFTASGTKGIISTGMSFCYLK